MFFIPSMRARGRQHVVSRSLRRLFVGPLRNSMMKPGLIAKFVPETLVPSPLPVPAHLMDGCSNSFLSGITRIAQALAQDSFCVCKGAMDDSVVASAVAEIKQLFDSDLMSSGEFAVAGSSVPGAKQRQDKIVYLADYLGNARSEEAARLDQLVSLDKAMAKFGEAVIESLATIPGPHLGSVANGRPLHFTGRTDLMLTCYPGGGSAYGPHIDNTDGDGRIGLDNGRCFALIYYLNDSWNLAEHGGALRLHLPTGAASCASLPRARAVLDVAPSLDTMVMFRADQLVHEVRRAKTLRFAATMWFYAGT